MATDDAGNSSSAQFSILVQDTTPPVLYVPADFAVEATSAAGATVLYPPTVALDAATEFPVITFEPPSGSLFTLGNTPVLVTATDSAGNVSTAMFNVLVQDTTAPTIILPPPYIVEADSSFGAAVTYGGATASDAVTTSPAILYAAEDRGFS